MNRIHMMPEYALAVTVIQMMERWNVSIATDGNVLAKVGLCLINTFGEEPALILFTRVHAIACPSAGPQEAGIFFGGLMGTRSRAGFASFMYYAAQVGIIRMDYLIAYKDDHLAISSHS